VGMHFMSARTGSVSSTAVAAAGWTTSVDENAASDAGTAMKSRLWPGSTCPPTSPGSQLPQTSACMSPGLVTSPLYPLAIEAAREPMAPPAALHGSVAKAPNICHASLTSSLVHESLPFPHSRSMSGPYFLAKRTSINCAPGNPLLAPDSSATPQVVRPCSAREVVQSTISCQSSGSAGPVYAEGLYQSMKLLKPW